MAGYPIRAPHASGLLPVGQGHSIHWSASGNPDGKPAVILHGGPGSGSSPGYSALFDPERYRIVAFDQRGCGLSRPLASDEDADMSANTTQHLVADIEVLREHLGIGRWLVFGASWGSTLALAYAEEFPERVAAIVLAGVTTTRRSEIDWLYRGLGAEVPEIWRRFRDGAPAGTPDTGLVEAYARLLFDADPAVREKAARDFHDYEAASISADPDAKPPARWADPNYRLMRARIVTHYFGNAAWLEEGALLARAGRLQGIPGVLVHGAADQQASLSTAHELAAAWQDAELVIVGGAGHSTGDAGVTEAIVAATDRFAS